MEKVDSQSAIGATVDGQPKRLLRNSLYQMYARYSTTTKTIAIGYCKERVVRTCQSDCRPDCIPLASLLTALSTANAATHTSTKLTSKTIVATTLTGLNICLNCFMNPMRNPVPTRERTIPME